jgi:hypothetical protein
MEAAPEHGGLGLLPPWRYDYGRCIKCSCVDKWTAVTGEWHAQLDLAVNKLVRAAPGMDDISKARNRVVRFVSAVADYVREPA